MQETHLFSDPIYHFDDMWYHFLSILFYPTFPHLTFRGRQRITACQAGISLRNYGYWKISSTITAGRESEKLQIDTPNTSLLLRLEDVGQYGGLGQNGKSQYSVD